MKTKQIYRQPSIIFFRYHDGILNKIEHLKDCFQFIVVDTVEEVTSYIKRHPDTSRFVFLKEDDDTAHTIGDIRKINPSIEIIIFSDVPYDGHHLVYLMKQGANYYTETQLSQNELIDLVEHCYLQFINKDKLEQKQDVTISSTTIDINEIKSKVECYLRTISTTLLIVEDGKPLRNALCRYFMNDYRVIGVENAKEALEKSKKENTIDVICLDIGLPDQDGISLIDTFKADHPLVQIIMLTAYDKLEYITSTFETGIYDYIIKPTDMSELSSLIHRAMVHKYIHVLYPEAVPIMDHYIDSDDYKSKLLSELSLSKFNQGDPFNYGHIYERYPEFSLIDPKECISPSYLENRTMLSLIEDLYILHRNRSIK